MISRGNDDGRFLSIFVFLLDSYLIFFFFFGFWDFNGRFGQYLIKVSISSLESIIFCCFLRAFYAAVYWLCIKPVWAVFRGFFLSPPLSMRHLVNLSGVLKHQESMNYWRYSLVNSFIIINVNVIFSCSLLVVVKSSWLSLLSID